MEALYTITGPLDELLIGTLHLVRPWQRVVFMGVAAAGIQHLIKPTYAYQGDHLRPFALTTEVSEEDQGLEPTIFPWWVVPSAVGGLAGLFI